MAKRKKRNPETEVRQWNRATSLANIAHLWGCTKAAASYRATKLRKNHPTLKKFVLKGRRKRKASDNSYKPHPAKIRLETWLIRQRWGKTTLDPTPEEEHNE